MPVQAKESGQSGSVLILVLWVVFTLAALTVAIGSHVASVMAISDRLWRTTQSRALAEAGANRAFALAMSQTNAFDAAVEGGWNRDEVSFSDYELGDGTFSVEYTTLDDSGVITTNIGIIGEDGKLNLNAIVRDGTLRKTLVNMIADLGGEGLDGARDIAGKIVAYIGGDDGLTDDAKNGYSGQSSTNALLNELQSLAELQEIPGVGEALYKALKPYVTVYGSGFINLNGAPKAVLVALAKACDKHKREESVYEALASKIVSFREGGGLFDVRKSDAIRKELTEGIELSGAEQSVWGSMIGGSVDIKSTAFRGVASGVCAGAVMADVKIEFVFDTEKSKFVYWHEMQ